MKRPALIASLGALMTCTSLTASAQRSDTVVIRATDPVHPGVATLVEELTLGNGSTAPEYLFTHAFLFPGRDGSVFVVDVRDPHNVGDFRSAVRQYDRNGTFVRAVGRIGQGPGEYTGRVTYVQQLPDGRILLAYPRGVLVYSATGEYIDQWATPATAFNVTGPLLIDPAGFVSVYARQMRFQGRVTTPPLPMLYRFRLDGTPVDTTTPAEQALPGPVMVPGPVVDGRRSDFQLPFGARSLSAWSPLGYLVTARSATYALNLHTPRRGTSAQAPAMWRPGDPITSIRRSAPPVRVQDAERADWRQDWTMIKRATRAGASWSWTGPDIPQFKPVLRDLSIDSEGRIWARLSQPARLNQSIAIPTRPIDPAVGYSQQAPLRWVEPFLFDVIEPSGRYLGQVRFPDNLVQTPIPADRWFARGDTVWAVISDQDDVPSVKRYRIRW